VVLAARPRALPATAPLLHSVRHGHRRRAWGGGRTHPPSARQTATRLGRTASWTPQSAPRHQRQSISPAYSIRLSPSCRSARSRRGHELWPVSSPLPTPHLPWPTRWTDTSGASSRLRSSWAFKATTIVDSDMRIAPTLIGRTKPTGARTPAARGTDSRLYPAAHHRFCFIFRYVARESSTIDRTDRGSSEARMTPA